MKTLSHLVAGDLRRFWPGLALWSAFIAARILLAEARFDPAASGGAPNLMPLAGTLLNWATILLAAVLVVQIVQAHPAVGSSGFWMTRPFAPLAIAGAKTLLLLGVFAGVPALATAIQMLFYGMRSADIALVAVQTLFLYGAGAAFVMAVAALTPSLPRAVVLGGGLAVAATILAFVAVAWNRESIAVADVSAVLVSASDMPLNYGTPAPGLLPGIFLLAGGLATLAVQYVRRARWASALVGLVCLLLAVLSEGVQPFSIQTHTVRPPAWTAGEDAVRMAIAGDGQLAFAVSEEWYGIERRRRRIARATGAVKLENVQAGWLASAALSSATLAFEDGARLESGRGRSSTFLAWGDEGNAPREEAIRDTLDAAWMPPARRFSRPAAVPLVVAPEAEMKDFAGRRAAYEGRFTIFLTRLDVAGTMPVAPGATVHDGGYQLAIDEVALEESVLRIRARAASVATMLDRTPRPLYEIYLRHPGSGDALRPSNVARDWGRFNMLWGLHVFIAPQGFDTETLTIWFDRDAAAGRAALATSDAWLREMQLVLIRTRYDGRLTRTLRIPVLVVDLPAMQKKAGG